jgi:hypothetical protein
MKCRWTQIRERKLEAFICVHRYTPYEAAGWNFLDPIVGLVVRWSLGFLPEVFMFRQVVAAGILAGVGIVTPTALADVFGMPAGETSLDFVTVGEAGNAPDTTGIGSVPYTYQMGEFDVTAGQYLQFLNSTFAVFTASCGTTQLVQQHDL